MAICLSATTSSTPQPRASPQSWNPEGQPARAKSPTARPRTASPTFKPASACSITEKQSAATGTLILRGSVSDARESRCQAADVPGRSRAPGAAVDLPGPVGSLDDVEGNRAGLKGGAAAAAADLPPALSRDARQATVPGEPGGGRSRGWPAAPV